MFLKQSPVKVFIISLVISAFSFNIFGCAPSQEKAAALANTLTVWHWMSDREEAFEELALRYEKETGNKVKFELYAPSEAYAQRVKASAQTNTLPDVFGVLGEKRDFASFIKSGYVADLTPALTDTSAGTAWKDGFFEKALAVNEFKQGNEYSVVAGFYGVPLDVMTIQMVYNKNLYRQAGLDPEKAPQTWEEFAAHCKALKAKGISRFVSGFGEIWMIDAFCTNLAMNQMGEQKVFDTYAGKVSYTDPDWIKVFSAFKQMADEKMAAEGLVTMVNKSAEQTFANERAAYAFNGSWCINVYKGMNPRLDYGAMLPPKLNASAPMKVWGGAGSSFVVNEKSPRKTQAIAFLKWLTSDAQQAYLSQATENLPANKNSLKQLPGVLAQFADDMDNTTHPNIYPVHENPTVSEALNKGIQSILIGEKTPEQVAQDVQKAKQAQSK